jgi:hypothetical protein
LRSAAADQDDAVLIGQRFDEEKPGGTWKSWVDHHGGGRSASDVRKLIGIAKAADPEAKAAEVRELAGADMTAMPNAPMTRGPDAKEDLQA